MPATESATTIALPAARATAAIDSTVTRRSSASNMDFSASSVACAAVRSRLTGSLRPRARPTSAATVPSSDRSSTVTRVSETVMISSTRCMYQRGRPGRSWRIRATRIRHPSTAREYWDINAAATTCRIFPSSPSADAVT